jgi:HK97 family phage portal protein
MNGQEFRQAMWTQRLLWGNAYAAIRRDGAGKIAALIPKKAEHVVVNREDWGIKYEYTTESGTEVYENRINQPPQMLHWKGWGPDGVIGLSTLSYARHTMGITLSADRKAATSFSGRPNGVLATDTFLTPEQRDDLRGLYEGVGNSTVGDGQMWLLEGGFKYEPIGLPPDDLQMLQTRAFQLAEICRFFGVPQVMLDGGEKGASWPASYEKQVLAFKTFTLGPFFEEFEQKVAEVFGDGRYAEHDSSGLVRPDSQTMAAYLATLVSNGLMTRNEARRQLKLPAMDQEGADDLTVQLNMAGLDDLHEGDGNAEQAPQPNQ